MTKMSAIKSVPANKKGFTLVELVVSVLFIAVIAAAATMMWTVGTKIFKDTGADTLAYSEATAFEGILRGAALTTEDLLIKGRVAENSDEAGLEADLIAYLDWENRDNIAFGFNKGFYKVAYFTDGTADSFTFLTFDTLNAPDQFQVGFSKVGQKTKMKYKIGKKQDGTGYLVEGSIILEQGTVRTENLDGFLNDEIMELGNLYTEAMEKVLLFEKGKEQ